MSERVRETPQFKSPEEELDFLRAEIAKKEEMLRRANVAEASRHAETHVIREYARTPTEAVLHETYALSENEVEGIALDIPPDDDDAVMGELLKLAHEGGIKNALSALEKMNSPHLEDDFHKVLVQYVKSGYPVLGFSEKSPEWEAAHMTLYEVSLPETASEEDRGRGLKEMVSSMEQFYAGMLAVSDDKTHRHFAIEIAVDQKRPEAAFYVSVPSAKKDLFEKQLLSIFPKAHIFEQKNDYNIFVKDGAVAMATATLSSEALLPLKTYQEFDYDPLNVLINAFSKIEGTGEGAAIQFVVKPENERHLKRYRTILEKMEKGKKLKDAVADTPDSVSGEVWKVMKEFASVARSSKKEQDKKKEEPLTPETLVIEQIRKKIETGIPSVVVRVAVSSATESRANDIMAEIESAFRQFENTSGNKVVFKRISERLIEREVKRFSFREFDAASAVPLSLRELTSLIHFPQSGMSSAPHLSQIKAGTAPAPLGLPTEGTLLGINTFRNQDTKAYLTVLDRMRHLYVIGQTGTGKSVFLKNLIIQDIEAGYGGCFIDPHGSDVQDILANIPEHRHADVVYFDPAYTERVMGLNMLEFDATKPEQKTFVVNELFSIFRKLYGSVPESMGPAFEQYFRNATMLVLEDTESGSTLLDVSRVLADARYRELKLLKAKNPVVVQFWRDIASKAQGEASLANIVPYITNKFDVFTANEIMRPIIAQQQSSFDFRELMDNRKILLVNLSKGRLGDINANLIGLILVGKILMAALSRADGKGDMPPFFLHIDEFQNITTDSIATILSEARKYNLSLTVAHQFIAQIDAKIKEAVFGNVGSMAVFRVGAEDAQALEPQFAPVFTQNDIMNIDNFNAYVRLLANGKPTKPFNVKTMPAPSGNREQVEMLKQQSYQKYGAPREEVEKRIVARYLPA